MSESARGSETCFVMMPFGAESDIVFEKAIEPAVQHCGLTCVRADKSRKPGPIIGHIYEAIEHSTVCIADLTGGNPNVLAEYGYAHAKRKPVILIRRGDPLDLRDLPFDVRHLRVIAYQTGDESVQNLRRILTDSLTAALGSVERLRAEQVLKEMLVPESLLRPQDPDERFVVAASPLTWRGTMGLGGGFGTLQRTSSDHVGIRGLIQAFGLIYGLKRLPDLVNPEDYEDEVVEGGANFYCIGSPKANRWTGLLLNAFYKQWTPRLEFKADPTSRNLRNVSVMVEYNDVFWLPPGFPTGANRRSHDFGLVIRGPHPVEPQHMLMVLAGRSALGTEAACRAATDPEHVNTIKKKVGAEAKTLGCRFDLNDHTCSFWAAAHMQAARFEAIPSTLNVAWAQPFLASTS